MGWLTDEPSPELTKEDLQAYEEEAVGRAEIRRELDASVEDASWEAWALIDDAESDSPYGTGEAQK